ncbi:MAG: hypothetical protein AAF629_13100 [Chloroflexota bacterium]
MYTLNRKKVNIEKTAETLRISWPWHISSKEFYGVLALFIFFASFTIISYNNPLILIVCGGFSLFLLYGMLTGFYNVTEIKIGPQEFRISHGPIPGWFFGTFNKRIDANRVQSVQVRLIKKRNRYSTFYINELFLTETSGASQRIIRNESSAISLRRIETIVNEFLQNKPPESSPPKIN